MTDRKGTDSMRVMGLDFGSKTVGVSVSDPLGVTAQGVEIIRRTSENKLRQTLAYVTDMDIDLTYYDGKYGGVMGSTNYREGRILIDVIIISSQADNSIFFIVSSPFSLVRLL